MNYIVLTTQSCVKCLIAAGPRWYRHTHSSVNQGLDIFPYYQRIIKSGGKCCAGNVENCQAQISNGEKKPLQSAMSSMSSSASCRNGNKPAKFLAQPPPPCFWEGPNVRDQRLQWKRSHFALVFYQHFKSIS